MAETSFPSWPIIAKDNAPARRRMNGIRESKSERRDLRRLRPYSARIPGLSGFATRRCSAGADIATLPGRDPRPLFVSALLHGNEDSGLVAAQEALRRWSSRELPRALLLFIGNVRAAAQNLRTLPGQHDFNRVWPGTATPDAPEARMARWIYDYVARRRPFASLDIHNNTGFNPHYAC